MWFQIDPDTQIKNSLGVCEMPASRDEILAGFDERVVNPTPWDKQFKKMTLLEQVAPGAVDHGRWKGRECSVRHYE